MNAIHLGHRRDHVRAFGFALGHLSRLPSPIYGKSSRTAIPARCEAALAALAQRARFGTTVEVWNLFAKGSRQVDLMVLLLHQDLANLFRHRVFSKRFTLPDAIAVIANGFVFIVEI